MNQSGVSSATPHFTLYMYLDLGDAKPAIKLQNVIKIILQLIKYLVFGLKQGQRENEATHCR